MSKVDDAAEVLAQASALAAKARELVTARQEDLAIIQDLIARARLCAIESMQKVEQLKSRERLPQVSD